MLSSTLGATIMQSAMPNFLLYLLFADLLVDRVDMFAAVFNTLHRHFMMISTNFTRNSKVSRKLSSIAIARKAEVLDVPDGKEIEELDAVKTLYDTHPYM